MIETGALAAELLAAYDEGRQILRPSARDPGFGLAEGYAVARAVRDMRLARGEKLVGRKIGFTNQGIWEKYGIDSPMWGYVWDTTLTPVARAGIALPPRAEPRIEPEIVLCLGAPVSSTMTDAEILAALDWVAHGFEVVFSPYPNWVLTAADCAAGFGLHAALMVGRRIPASTPGLAEALPALKVRLTGPGFRAEGVGANVLGGPLNALRFLAKALESDPLAPPLVPGEIITTGTLIDGIEMERGQRWTTEIEGIDLDGMDVTFI